MTDADDAPAPAEPSPASALGDADSGIRPRRDAVAAAVVVLSVSVLGLAVTAFFAERYQKVAARNELEQMGRIATTRIDVDAHQRLAATAPGPAHRRLLAPLVAMVQATDEISAIQTAVRADGGTRVVLDTSALFRRPGHAHGASHGDDEAAADADLARTLETGSPLVRTEPAHGAAHASMRAYVPFADQQGRQAGVVRIDTWPRALDDRLARLRRITLTAGAGLVLLSALAGLLVFRLRSLAAAAAARDRQALAALAAARDAAEQSGRAKSAFLAMMSHELRTPLTAIVGYSELMHEELSGRGLSQHADDIGRVRTAGLHLSAVIADILDFSKIDAGRLQLTPAAVDLAALLRDVEQHVRRAADDKGLTLQVFCPAATAWLDPLRLRQVLVNLVANGVKFTESGGVTVRVAAEPGDAGRFVCTVHDTGVGIPADKRGRLFKPFSQVDSSMTRRAGGSGLGLVISHRLVEAMGGRLTVRSRVGHGSAFRVSLPGVLRAARRAA